MLKLYAVMLGGRADGCNTELHDVVFAVGKSLTETYSQLKNKWFGQTKRLHIDSYIEITHVDGYEIHLSKEPIVNVNLKLYFINFGGYQPGYFGELHHVGFYVGQDKTEVLNRAKTELSLSLEQRHCDDHYLVDDMLMIDTIDQYHINLVPSTISVPFNIVSCYLKLDQ